jgi:hypothetical protein
MKIITDHQKFEKMKITDRNPAFFYEEFEKQRRNSTSNFEAWERTEQRHIELTGAPRYSDFESFRTCRNRKKNHNQQPEPL